MRPPEQLPNDTLPNVSIIANYANPLAVLAILCVAFSTVSALKSSAAAKAADNGQVQYGPGGKVLPTKKSLLNKEHVQTLDFSRRRKMVFYALSLLTCLTFVVNAGLVILRALVQREEGWWCGKPYTIYVVGNFFVYSLIFISVIDCKPSPNTPHLVTWIGAFLLEVGMVAINIAIYSKPHREHRIRRGRLPEYIVRNMSDWEAAQICVDFFRIFFLALSAFLYIVFVISRNNQLRQAQEAADREEAQETTGLLDGQGQPNGANGSTSYGATTANGPPKPAPPAPAGWERPEKNPSRSWWEYIKGYGVFFPFLWPYKDRRLQLVVVLCVVVVAIQRVVNLMVVQETATITNILAGESGPSRLPWGHILIYICLRYCQGTQGLLGAIRGNLWIPVSQYSFRELSIASFEHVHGLSLDFHLGKKTGEVLSALGKGNSINTFLEQVTFSVMPMIADLVIAVGWLLTNYDAYYALVVALVTFWYIYITIRMARWRADIRRNMVNADREEEAVKNDSMVSYETVKYFNAEPWEFTRYRGALGKFQKAEARVMQSLNIMNVAQNSVFTLGLLAVCYLAAYQVASGQRKIGAFTALLQYMVQLQAPLNFFGTFYRLIQQSMINAERLLELFKEKPTVVDTEGARPLSSCEGAINFNEVKFAYDSRKPALNGLSFECKPGTTTALVGESGGGKSTVFRLLFRFYNQTSGSIQIDGHDVQDLTIESLRKHIGVVPQDTVLFNESLMYNLKYANQDVTDEEVFAACRKASIHERIMAFPDQYNTKVGERGLRLSGGEKQRVAIARTILKNPRIIMLDEATAALDTETEEHIQEALTSLGTGRTMILIAHRLSTITQCDQIIVLKDGKAIEKGTHEGLLATKGHYATMWKKQIRAQRVADEAKALKDKADRLKAEAGQMGAPSSGDTSANHSSDEEAAKDEPPKDALEELKVSDNAPEASSKTLERSAEVSKKATQDATKGSPQQIQPPEPDEVTAPSPSKDAAEDKPPNKPS